MIIKEKDLDKFLQDFKSTNMILEFSGGIESRILLQEATIMNIKKQGYIIVKSKDFRFKINTTIVHRYEIEKDSFLIILDMITIKITKKN